MEVDLEAAEGANSEGEEVFNLDADGQVAAGESVHSLPAQGNKRICAQFGRKRTHNEQLIVCLRCP